MKNRSSKVTFGKAVQSGDKENKHTQPKRRRDDEYEKEMKEHKNSKKLDFDAKLSYANNDEVFEKESDEEFTDENSTETSPDTSSDESAGLPFKQKNVQNKIGDKGFTKDLDNTPTSHLTNERNKDTMGGKSENKAPNIDLESLVTKVIMDNAAPLANKIVKIIESNKSSNVTEKSSVKIVTPGSLNLSKETKTFSRPGTPFVHNASSKNFASGHVHLNEHPHQKKQAYFKTPDTPISRGSGVSSSGTHSKKKNKNKYKHDMSS